MTLPSSLRESLTAIVGAEFVRTDEETYRGVVSAWPPETAFARRESGVASPPVDAVVFPANTSDVARVLRCANETRTSVFVAGGASNIVLSGPPSSGNSGTAIVLDLSRLADLSWDEESLLVRAGAGLKLGEIEERLNAHEYTLGQFPLSLSRLTAGGAVAMDAIGLLYGRYGRPRDITLALTAVLPGGEIVRTASPPLGSAAFDLNRLLIGTEGVFGVVTEVTFAMRPQPEARAWAAFAFPRRDDAIDALRLIFRSDSRPAMARILDATQAPSFQLLLAFEGDELAQTGPYQLAYAICQQTGGEPLPPEIGEEWFESRRHGTGFLAANARPDGIADMLAVSAPWSSLKAVEGGIRAAVAPLVDRLGIDIAHPGPNGAALVVTFEARAESGSAIRATAYHGRIVDAALEAVQANGGAVAFHLGTGRSRRRHFLSGERGEGGLVLLRAIKAALDPNNILNPGILP